MSEAIQEEETPSPDTAAGVENYPHPLDQKSIAFDMVSSNNAIPAQSPSSIPNQYSRHPLPTGLLPTSQSYGTHQEYDRQHQQHHHQQQQQYGAPAHPSMRYAHSQQGPSVAAPTLYGDNSSHYEVGGDMGHGGIPPRRQSIHSMTGGYQNLDYEELPPLHHQSHVGGGPAATSSSGVPRPIRRRMRMITSCLECRRRKLKCNKSAPCINCIKFSRDCVYLGSKLDEASQLRLTEIKEKVGSLERQLERDVAKTTNKGSTPRGILADDVEGDVNEERDLEMTPMVALDLAYEDDADATDDIIDLGVRVGHMRITERIGGLIRPRLAEEIQAGLSDKGAPQAGYQGQNTTPPGNDIMSDAGTEASIPEFLRPSRSYIPPTSGFFFGQIGDAPAFIGLNPSRELGDHLLQQYWKSAHPIARCVHRPSFEQQYATFWEEVSYGYEPQASIQALVFAAWFTAAVSIDEEFTVQQHGYLYTKQDLINQMKIGTEAALAKANFLRTTKVDTMQAFIMYLIPLCRAEVSRAHSVLIGAAVRMAECMGLHRDGETYGLNPLETHVRRLLWHQLCFLDIRTCEAQGPRPAIRREDYDTKLPVNREEDQIMASPSHGYGVQPQEPSDSWTSTLLPLIRFEINEMMRIIWADRRRLETKKTTLTAVLSKIENFRKRMVEKYDRFLSDDVPIQRYARHVMALLIYRLHAMVLHPYHANTQSPMPPRLNNLLISAGIMIVEISIKLETDPEFKDWSWYLGAYSQYQIALLLATELQYRPDNKQADRIWSCLDYVFDVVDRSMPRKEKAAAILSEIATKMEAYKKMRKMRATTGIAQAVPAKQAVKPDTPTPTPTPAVRAMPPPPQQQYGAYQNQQQQQHQYIGMQGVKIEPQAHMTMMPPPHPGRQQQGSMSSAMAQQMQLPNNMPTARPPPPGPAMQYAGVSNGEVLWSVPPGHNPGASPASSSDGGSIMGQGQHQQRVPSMGGNPFENINWDEFDNTFNLNQQTGELNLWGFTSPNLGMRWGSG